MGRMIELYSVMRSAQHDEAKGARAMMKKLKDETE